MEQMEWVRKLNEVYAKIREIGAYEHDDDYENLEDCYAIENFIESCEDELITLNKKGKVTNVKLINPMDCECDIEFTSKGVYTINGSLVDSTSELYKGLYEIHDYIVVTWYGEH